MRRPLTFSGVFTVSRCFTLICVCIFKATEDEATLVCDLMFNVLETVLKVTSGIEEEIVRNLKLC